MQKCSSVLHLIIFIFLRIFSFSSLKEKRKYFITTFIIWNTIWFIIQSIRENWKEQDVLLWCSDPYFTFHYKILTSEFQVWYQILDHGYQFVSYQFVNPQWRFPGICSQMRAKGDSAWESVSQSHLEIMAMVPKIVNTDISPRKVLDGLHRPRGQDKQKEAKKPE